jgi:hypothetical protein
MRVSRIVAFGALAVGIVALPMAALAGHGKAGLWDVTVMMNMPNMPQIPPEQMAKMKAMGINIPNSHAMTVQHCMTAAEVAAERPPQMQHNGSCSQENVKFQNGTFTADMVCNGADMQGSGHVTVTYDSDTHYAGQMTFEGTSHGHPASMTNRFEGKWVSADCGTIGH